MPGESRATSVARPLRPLSEFARSSPCWPIVCSTNQEWFGQVMQPLGASAMARIFSQAASTSAHVSGISVTPAASSSSMFENMIADEVFQGIE